MRLLAGSLFLVLMMLPGVGVAGAAPAWEVGVRGGMDATGSNEHYEVAELYLQRDLPWRAETGLGPVLTRLDLGAAYLEGAGSDGGAILSAGADIAWRPANGPMELEAGFRPAWLTDHRYGDDDYGGGLQFLSHVGVSLRLGRFVLGYRYQHMSNAGIYSENDGLNLHLFGVGGTF